MGKTEYLKEKGKKEDGKEEAGRKSGGPRMKRDGGWGREKRSQRKRRGRERRGRGLLVFSRKVSAVQKEKHICKSKNLIQVKSNEKESNYDKNRRQKGCDVLCSCYC